MLLQYNPTIGQPETDTPGAMRRGPANRFFAWRNGIIRSSMNEITQVLQRIQQGEPSAAEALLPLVYEELRKLAAQKMAQEPGGQTLQPTALVHEAYLRLVDVEQRQRWD